MDFSESSIGFSSMRLAGTTSASGPGMLVISEQIKFCRSSKRAESLFHSQYTFLVVAHILPR